jgi:heterotetrameric sarcosine oxidase delta subunit
MRIPCPYCGERSNDEFTILGDAEAILARPANSDAATFHDYLYLRRNPPGPHRELWHHSAGCRRWLIVSRDTRTHAVLGATFAGSRGADGDAP